MDVLTLWDIESVPFRRLVCLVRKYLRNELNIEQINSPMFIACSPKNIHLVGKKKMKKKRGYEIYISPSCDKNSADNELYMLSKDYPNATVVLISNDLKLVKRFMLEGRNVVLFYNNKDMDVESLGITAFHIYTTHKKSLS